MASLQELHGRRGRTITDKNAQEITRVEELAYDLKINDVMSRELHVVLPEMSMADLLDILRDAQISGTPVVMAGKMVGIVSLEDLIRSMRANDLGSPIRQYMTTEVIAARSYDPIIEAIEMLTKHHVGRLPVLDENENLVGIITKETSPEVSLSRYKRTTKKRRFADIGQAIFSKILFPTAPA
jgi:predicted transcriptional regulator